jgi:outer membrane protein
MAALSHVRGASVFFYVAMKWMLFILLSLLLLLVTETRSYGKAMTLEEALKYGLTHSPTLSSALKRRDIADMDVKTRKSAFLPSLDLEGTHGLQETHPESTVPGSTDPWVSGFSLKLTETLYDNGESITRLKQAKLQRQLAELGAEKERNQLILNIVSQFYDFSIAQKRAEAQRDLYSNLEKQTKSVSFQYRQGLKTRKDYLRLKSQVQNAEVTTRSAESALEKASIQLHKLIGAPFTGEKMVFEPLDVNRASGEAPRAAPALENTLEVRIAKLERDLKPLDVSLAQRNYWPQLKLAGGANYGANSYINSAIPYGQRETYGWNVLLTLKYNLWDWGTLSREVEKARVNEMITENELTKTQLETRAEIESLMIQMRDLSLNSALSESLLQAQEDAFRIVDREYREGQTPYLDYVNSLKERLEAKILYAEARFQLASTLAKYQYYEGKLYDAYFSKQSE